VRICGESSEATGIRAIYPGICQQLRSTRSESSPTWGRPHTWTMLALLCTAVRSCCPL
ncbi:unnamed protein product, partial [Symbiodinium pilosum]